MGNRIQDDYVQFRKAGISSPDSALAVMPAMKEPAVVASGMFWETTEAPPVRPPVGDTEVVAADTGQYVRDIFQIDYGFEPRDATVLADQVTEAMRATAGEPLAGDTAMTRNVIRDLRAGRFAMAQADSDMGTATAVTLDTTLELPDLGVTIPNIDQFFTHQRNVAAGRYTEAVDSLAGYKTDMAGLMAAVDGTWGTLQQAWFGYRIGESWQDILRRRLWPMVVVRDDEGNEEKKAVLPHLMDLGFRRTMAEVSKWSPMMLSSAYRERRSENIREVREDIGELLESDWHQNVIRGDDVTAYNLMGYGWDPMTITPSNPSGIIMGRLPAAGTPERERVDAAVRQGMTEAYQKLGETAWGRTGIMLLKGRGLVSEFVEDPLFFAGEAAPTAVNLGRRALALSTRARVTGAIARHTGAPFDVAAAMDDALEWAARTKRRYDSMADQLAPNPEVLEQARIQMVQAQDNLVRLKAMQERFAEGTTEQFLTTNFPQANPVMVARIGRVYLESNPETAVHQVETMLRNLQREADVRVSIVKRRLETPQAADDPNFFRRQLALAEEEATNVRRATEWFESKASRPEASRLSETFREALVLDKPYAPDALDFAEVDMALARENADVVRLEISRNLRRGMASGAPEEQLMQWEVTLNMLNDGTLTPAQAMRRVTQFSGDDLVRMDIKSARIGALRNTPESLVDVHLIDEPTTSWNRQTAGPDAGEQAGNAAMKLAAGADMDDVSIRAMTPDTYFNATAHSPRARLGMDDAPNAWLGDEAFRTNVEAAEWQQSIWERTSDVFAKGLYPKAHNFRPIALLAQMREVGWALENINPRLARRMENALMAEEWELQRMLGFFESEFRAAGIIDEAGEVIEEAALMWGKRMNLAPESEAYKAMMATLSPGEMRSLRRLRAGYDFMGDKLGLRNTDRRLVGHIAHVLDDADFPAGTIDPVFQGVPADEAVFFPFMEWRFKDPADLDINVVTATDRYIRGAVKKLHRQPLIEDLRQAGLQAALVDPKLGWANTYINHLIDILQGRPSVLGSFVQNMFANEGAFRRAAQMLDERYARPDSRMVGINEMIQAMPSDLAPVTSRVREKVHGAVYGASTLAYMGALGGNRRYFPMTISTGLATSGARFGWWRQNEGILMLARPEWRDLAEKAGVRNHFTRLLDPLSGTDAAKNIQKFSQWMSNQHLLTPSLQFSENTIRGWAFNAGLSELMTRTGFRSIDDVRRAGLLNSYIAEAAFTTQNINHRFGMFGRAPWMRRLSESLTTATTQFLTFPFKQAETLAWLFRENPGYIARYMAYSGALTRMGNAAGVDLGQYVGFPGVADLDTKSIMTETISTLLDAAIETRRVLAEEGDPSELNTIMKRAGEQTTNLVPFANMAQSWWRSYHQLTTGEDRRPYGLVRELDMGMYEWDDDKSVMENLSNIPLGFASEDGGPTDMASILTGLRATEANIEKAQYDAAMQQLKREAFYRRRISDEFAYMLNTGDDAEFNRLLQEALDKGVLPPEFERLANETVKSHALPRLLRLEADKIEQVYDVLDQIRSRQRR